MGSLRAVDQLLMRRVIGHLRFQYPTGSGFYQASESRMLGLPRNWVYETNLPPGGKLARTGASQVKP
jgi:hypothetical protein